MPEDGLGLVLRHKKLILLVAVLTALVAFVASQFQQRVYEASGEILLQARRTEQLFSPTDTVASDTTQVQTELQVLKSESVRSLVSQRLGRVPMITAAAVGETNVIRLSAQSTNRQEAARIVNTYADTYIDSRRQQLIDDLLKASSEVQAKVTDVDSQLRATDGPISDLESQIAAIDARTTGNDANLLRQLTAERSQLSQELAVKRRQADTLQEQKTQYKQQLDQLQLASNLTQTGGAQVISRAAPPQSPVRPQPVRNAALGLFAGLMLGVGLAVIQDRSDNAVRDEGDVADATGGLRVLGTIPTVPGWRRTSSAILISQSDPNSRVAEAYRSLRTSVQFLGGERACRAIQLTSAVPDEGKTASVANLGVALAQAGLRVTLVSCDLRRPRLHEFFGISNDVGFSSVVLGEVALRSAVVHPWAGHNLAVLPSGPPPTNPSELLASERAAKILRVLIEHSDFTIIDSAPVLPVTDGVVLARMMDATILIARAGKTTTAQLRRTVERLRQVDAPLAGAVLNQFDPVDGAYYGGYYPDAPPVHRTWADRFRSMGANGSDDDDFPATNGRVRRSADEDAGEAPSGAGQTQSDEA